MQKGQISIDLLLTLILALAVITSMSYMLTEIKNTHEENTARNSLFVLTQKTASLINATNTLNDTNYSIQIKLDKITYTNKEGTVINIYPTVTIDPDSGELILSAKINEKTVNFNAKIYLPGGTRIDTAQANGTISITHTTRLTKS
jgi:hypothetical protein